MAEPSAAIVREIENNLLLRQALQEIREIKATQEVNHLVSLQLRDHKTIERVDTLWVTLGQLNFLMKIIAGLLAAIPILAAFAAFMHIVFRLP